MTSTDLLPIELVNGLIISIKEAKKLVGKDFDGLSDDEVASKIIALTDLAQTLLNTSNTSNLS